MSTKTCALDKYIRPIALPSLAIHFLIVSNLVVLQPFILHS